MGLRIMVGREEGHRADEMAIIYSSTTGIPLAIECFSGIDSEDAARKFIEDASDEFGQDIRHVPINILREYQARWFRNNRDLFE